VKPVRFVVPYPPAVRSTNCARSGQKLTPVWTSRCWSTTAVARAQHRVDVVAKSPADVIRWCWATPGRLRHVTLRKNLPYDPRTDLAPVTQIIARRCAGGASVDAVRSVKDLIALARAHPAAQLRVRRIGNLQHLGMENLQALAKVK